MGDLTQTQVTALVAAGATLLCLIAFLVHERRTTSALSRGEPWVRPAQPLLMLVIATVLSIVTAVLALQRR